MTHDAAVTTAIRGRDAEVAALEHHVLRATHADGAALRVVGDRGAGASLLLAHARDVARTAGARVLSAAGVEAEQDVPFAALHQLVVPLLTDVGPLSAVQAAAVRTALEDGTGTPSFALRAAVRTLLVHAATEQPLVCVVDSIHHLDDASALVLGFCARRLQGTRAVMVLATRATASPHTPGPDPFDDVPTLHLGPLDRAAARQIVADTTRGAAPDALADDLHDASGGIPGDLVALCATLTPAELAGHAPVPEHLPSRSVLRRDSRTRAGRLSPGARSVLALLACDPDLERHDLVACAATLGAGPQDVAECIDSGLVPFRSPLERSAVRSELPAELRSAAHAVVADRLERAGDPRHAWHRARSGARVSTADLVAAAETASRRGAHGWAALTLEEAAGHSADASDRSRLLVSAATAAWSGGATGRSRSLLRRAASVPGTAPDVALLLRGETELRTGSPEVAAAELLVASDRLAGHDPTASARALALAHEAACIAGDAGLRADALRRALATSREHGARPGPGALMTEHVVGLELSLRGEHDEARGSLVRVVSAARDADDAHARVLGSEAAFALGDGRTAYDLADGAAADAEANGDRAVLAWSMVYRSMAALLLGRHARAVASSLDGLAHAQEDGRHNTAVDHLTILALLSAVDGDRESAAVRVTAAADAIARRGLERPRTLAGWAQACTDLAVDRHSDALDRFRLMAVGGRAHPALRLMAVPHLVEAAVRGGERERAVRAVHIYDQWADGTQDVARRALSHRCHALLATDPAAVREHFTHAMELHETSGVELDLARTELLYASFLRRSRQPGAARRYLREALMIYEAHGSDFWADRVRAELRAAGGTPDGPVPDGVVGRVSAPVGSEHGPEGAQTLTAQQRRIAELAAAGATNKEIADHLVVSPRTVEHHLRNVFSRLGIRSRVEIARYLD
ncbi:ATP-binding protein [Sanguibacter suaedae]|uniref:AAA family ATPase n=1 Tax=Sanguibacter suaedae TaxID=2795737 RepID=A0A934MBT7_9MICO|nr:LuxR family transcriptional regulator [Sanguibacter suaedae]MBI9115661.1 AAA family ATPase [Sanguibacter suaedae]